MFWVQQNQISTLHFILLRRQKPKVSIRNTAPLYYSTVQSKEYSEQPIIDQPQYDYTEHTENSTTTINEEGVYNHLGDNDTRQELNSGPVYDHSGINVIDHYDYTGTSITNKDNIIYTIATSVQVITATWTLPINIRIK